MRPTLAFLIALTLLLLAPAAHAQLLQREMGGRVSAIPGAVVWGKGKYSDVKLHLKALVSLSPDAIDLDAVLIGRDSPNGIRFRVLPSPGFMRPRNLSNVFALHVDFGKGFAGLNEYGELQNGYFVQAAEFDVTGDSVPEIVVAVGNGRTHLGINIFQLNGELWKNQWKLIGKFNSQAKATLGKGRLTLPYGSQGRATKYLWQRGAFVKTK